MKPIDHDKVKFASLSSLPGCADYLMMDSSALNAQYELLGALQRHELIRRMEFDVRIRLIIAAMSVIDAKIRLELAQGELNDAQTLLTTCVQVMQEAEKGNADEPQTQSA